MPQNILKCKLIAISRVEEQMAENFITSIIFKQHPSVVEADAPFSDKMPVSYIKVPVANAKNVVLGSTWYMQLSDARF